MSGRSRALTWGLPIAGVAALVTGVVLVIENRPVRSEEQPPRQPTTAPALASDVDASRFVGAIGTSEPPGEPIAVAAHVAGVVASVEVEVGARVEADAVLFRVDARRAESEVALRRSRLDVAESDAASLRAQIPVRRATLASAEAALASARAAIVAAEADLEDRRNQLRIARSVDDPRAIAAEEIDRRRFAVMQAEARLRAAESDAAAAEARVAEATAGVALLVDPEGGGDGPELRAAVRRVDEARRELERARVDLELLSVRAPVAGVVLQVNVRPGELAPASVVEDGLVVLGREGPTHLRVEIDEVDVPRLELDARAWASPRGDATRRLALEPAYVEPLIVPKRNLSGRTSELVDTRVLQVVYRFVEPPGLPGVGQQYDVYIEAARGATEASP